MAMPAAVDQSQAVLHGWREHPRRIHPVRLRSVALKLRLIPDPSSHLNVPPYSSLYEKNEVTRKLLLILRARAPEISLSPAHWNG